MFWQTFDQPNFQLTELKMFYVQANDTFYKTLESFVIYDHWKLWLSTFLTNKRRELQATANRRRIIFSMVVKNKRFYKLFSFLKHESNIQENEKEIQKCLNYYIQKVFLCILCTLLISFRRLPYNTQFLCSI